MILFIRSNLDLGSQPRLFNVWMPSCQKVLWKVAGELFKQGRFHTDPCAALPIEGHTAVCWDQVLLSSSGNSGAVLQG